MRRIRAPRGSGTKPSANDMTHSLVPIRLTSKAEPPKKHIKTCTATSEADVSIAGQTQARELTNDNDSHKIPILRHALENVQLSIQAPAVERVEDLGEH